MARRQRLDAELVRRRLAGSRTQAAELIADRRVLLGGTIAHKPATQLDPAQALQVLDPPDGTIDYVSRGGQKLAGALDGLGSEGPAVEGRRALDAGASTGGFTDVLLRRGAQHVVAVDVGYGQLAWSLRSDSRVSAVDRTNIRTLDPAAVAPPPELVVGDLSFISLTIVLPALIRAAHEDADILLMIKPQFEVGKGRLGRGGVVRDSRLHAEAVATVTRRATELGRGVRAVVASPLPGPSGNVEYFVHFRRDGHDDEREIAAMTARAIANGPAGGKP